MKNPDYYLNWVIVALLNLIIIIGVWRYGLALSVDSANYFSVAENLSKGKGFLQFDDFPFLNAPPLYPILLTPAYLFNLPVQIYAILLQLLMVNISLFFLYRIIVKELQLSRSWLILLLSVGFFMNFIQVFVFATSETGFLMLLSIWFYLIIKDGYDEKKNESAFIFALLCMQRYAIWLILPGVVLFWLFQKKKLAFIFKQLVFGLLLSILWWSRNLAVSGKMLGEHQIGDKLNFSAIGENLRRIYDDFFVHRNLILGVVFFTAILISGLLNINKLEGKMKEFSRLILLSALSYLLLLLFQRNLSILQLPRYLSVFWTFLILVCFLVIEKRLFNKYFKSFLYLIFFVSNTFFLYQKFDEKNTSGSGGFNSSYWQKLRGEKDLSLIEGQLISNFPDMVWWISGRQCHYSPYLNEAVSDFYAREAGVKTLVWFNNPERNHVMKNKEEWLPKLSIDTLVNKPAYSLYRIKLGKNQAQNFQN